MRSLPLVAYFFVSYSIGLAALALSLANWLRRRSAAAWAFLLTNFTFAVLVASGMAQNLVESSAEPVASTILPLVNYGGAVATICALPFLTHSLYKPRRARSLNFGFLALAGAAVAAGLALAVAGRPAAGGAAILAVKDLSILYTIVRVLVASRRRRDGEIENVLFYATLGAVALYPLILASEFAPGLFRSILRVEARGAVVLPAIYALLSAAYLISWLRGYVSARGNQAGAFEDFSRRFGISPRETEVLRLLLGGKSYKEIMSSLSISMPTVKSHVCSIYRKTGCGHKMELSLLFSASAHTKA
jgi:DNA-binding CsgD family transcriptional regulator